MNLGEHYSKLYTDQSLRAAGNYEIDHLIDSEADNRLGITLMIRNMLKAAYLFIRAN